MDATHDPLWGRHGVPGARTMCTCCVLSPSAAPHSASTSAAFRGAATARQAVGRGPLQEATRHLPSDALTTAHCRALLHQPSVRTGERGRGASTGRQSG